VKVGVSEALTAILRRIHPMPGDFEENLHRCAADYTRKVGALVKVVNPTVLDQTERVLRNQRIEIEAQLLAKDGIWTAYGLQVEARWRRWKDEFSWYLTKMRDPLTELGIEAVSAVALVLGNRVAAIGWRSLFATLARVGGESSLRAFGAKIALLSLAQGTMLSLVPVLFIATYRTLKRMWKILMVEKDSVSSLEAAEVEGCKACGRVDLTAGMRNDHFVVDENKPAQILRVGDKLAVKDLDVIIQEAMNDLVLEEQICKKQAAINCMIRGQSVSALKWHEAAKESNNEVGRDGTTKVTQVLPVPIVDKWPLHVPSCYKGTYAETLEGVIQRQLVDNGVDIKIGELAEFHKFAVRVCVEQGIYMPTRRGYEFVPPLRAEETSIEEFLAGFKGAEKDSMAENLQNPKAPKKYTTVSAFPKTRELTNPTELGELPKVCRLISNVSTADKALIACATHGLNKVIMRDWGNFWINGRSKKEEEALMSDLVNTYESLGDGIEQGDGDCSKCDASQKYGLRAVPLDIYERLYPHLKMNFRSLRVTKAWFAGSRDDQKRMEEMTFNYAVLGTMASGSMDTTLSNTLLVTLITMFAGWKANGKKERMNNSIMTPEINLTPIVKGDDMCYFSEKPVADTISETFENLGMKMEVKRMDLEEQDVFDVEFCSGKYVYYRTYEGDYTCKFIRLIGRQVFRVGWYPAPVVGRGMRRLGLAKAISACFEADGIPVVASYARLMLKMAGAAMSERCVKEIKNWHVQGMGFDKDVRKKFEFQGINLTELPGIVEAFLKGSKQRFYAPIPDTLRQAFATSYQIEMSDQKSLENWLDGYDVTKKEVNIPSYYQPLFETILTYF